MKLITFKYKNKRNIFGIIKDGHAIPIENICINNKISSNMLEYLNNLSENENILSQGILTVNPTDFPLLEDIELQSPILKPNSLRDAYAFKQHVEAGRKSRGLEMIKEYDKFPVYYYGNHNSIEGPGDVFIEKDKFINLDYELEIAAVIGKKGKNIKVEDADDYIMGYTIMNDFSARKIQKEEMKLSLGPAKGKDFLTTLGPCIVTKDELSDYLINDSDGERYNLNMQAHLDGQLFSSDNFKNITWTFAQIISHISIGAHIYPGDVIGSGTCATGCLLELNQTNNTELWLKNSDVISLTVSGIGTLTNKIKIV